MAEKNQMAQKHKWNRSNAKNLSSGNTAQFSGAAEHAFCAICFLQKSRFTSSKPSVSAIASDTKFIAHRTTSFVRYCLKSKTIAV
jgi:hypothetical protein